jgi:hypothetical protein
MNRPVVEETQAGVVLALARLADQHLIGAACLRFGQYGVFNILSRHTGG